MNVKGVVPSKEILLQLMEISANSNEGPEYLQDRLSPIVLNSKDISPEIKESIIATIDDFVVLERFKQEPCVDPWSGKQMPSTLFSNLQENIAKDAVQHLRDTEALRLDGAISDNSDFVRGYSAQGKMLDAKLEKSMDKLFNSWLASSADPIITKTSVLFEANENGEIKQRADAEIVRQRLSDEKTGFAAYAKERGVDIEVRQFNYAEVVQVEEQEKVTPAAMPEVAVASKPSKEIEEKITPQTR